MPTKVRLLRYRFPDGRSKDWAYPTPVKSDAQNFTVYFGRTGSTLRQRDTPASACDSGNPFAEAAQRSREKRAKGYEVLGDYWLADNRQDLRPVTPTPAGPEPGVNAASDPTPASAGSFLYWRLRSVRDQEDQAALENICRAVAEQLDHVGWPVTRAGSGRNASAFWASVASGAIRSGRVELLPGHEPGIAFLLLVARRFAGLRVANEDQQVVTDWPQELPGSDSILETLGLKPVSTERLLADMAGEAWFY